MITAFCLDTKDMKYEKESCDWLIACMCRGLARYDANEVLQSETDGEYAGGHGNGSED